MVAVESRAKSAGLKVTRKRCARLGKAVGSSGQGCNVGDGDLVREIATHVTFLISAFPFVKTVQTVGYENSSRNREH
jgi:hypothetical protein